MAEVECDEYREGDVSSEEAGGCEFSGKEDLEAVGNGQDDEDDESDPCGVWLEDGLVRSLVEHVVEFKRFSEALGLSGQNKRERLTGEETYQIGHQQYDPCDKSTDCGQIQKPGEDRCRPGRDTEIDKTRQCSAEQYCDVWHALLVTRPKDFRRLSGDRKRV